MRNSDQKYFLTVQLSMAKKRKAGGRPLGRNKPETSNKQNSKLSIKSFEDVANSEDEFHINRDKILLEEPPAQKRQKRQQEEGMLVLDMTELFRLLTVDSRRFP